MSKMIIVEGNSNDKDNVRAFMVKGEKGYSAYEIAVKNGYIGTEEEWSDSFINADNYYNKSEVETMDSNLNNSINQLEETVNNEITSNVAILSNRISEEKDAREYADYNLQNQITSLASGSPLVASSTAGMTDTSRIYVNTTDGKWYYYNGSTWIAGGDYQSTGIAEESINFGNIAPATFNLVNSKYIEVEGVGVGITKGMSYTVSNDKITSTTNNKRCRFKFSIKSGILIKFNNPNGDYKYGVLSSPRGTDSPILDRYGIANYTSAWNNLYINSLNYNSDVLYHITLGFTDDRELTDEDVEELSNAIKIYQLNPKLIGKNIDDKTLGINNLYDIQYDDNNIPYTIYKYSILNDEMYKYETSRSILIPIKTNSTYYVKIAGSYNRSRVALLHGTPDELYEKYRNPSTDHIPLISNITGNYFIQGDNLLNGEIEFSTNDVEYRYALIYLYNINDSFPDFNLIDVQISSVSMPSIIEPANIKYPMFNSNDLYYTKIPSVLERTQYYYEEQYTSTQEMQGLATDGENLYYCCHGNTDNDTSCVGKISLATGEVIVKKNNTSYRHANGLCYYPKTNSLYIVSLTGFTNTSYPDIYILDADTLEQTGSVNLPELATYWQNFAYNTSNGVGAIAYSSELDRFIVLLQPSHRAEGQKTFYGLAIYTTDWNLDKLLKFETSDNHYNRGGLWANDKYIYIVSTLKNPYKDSITIVDYNGNTITHKIFNLSYTGIEGIVVDYENNLMYTSNSNDRIYKFDIKSYKNVSRAEVNSNYRLS